MNNEIVNLVIIGAGSIACSYARAISSADRIRISGIVDSIAEKASALAASCRCMSFNTVPSMLRELSPDAAIICTPPATHRDICIELAGRGVHMLCEKPFSINAADVEKMLFAARRASVVITVSSKFRHMEDIIQARALIQSGALGQIVRFSNTFSRRTPMAGRWNSDPSISGGGVIIDNGTHSLDVLCYFSGPPARIRAVESERSQGLHVEEDARLNVETESGVSGEIELSWNRDSTRDSFIIISCTEGELQIGWKESRYLLYSTSEWSSFGSGYNKTELLSRQIGSFISVIEGSAPAWTSHREISSTASAIDAAYLSLKTSEWVSISGNEEACE